MVRGGDSNSSLDSMLMRPLEAIALRDSDLKSLERSASGGAFAVFARAILESGGAVFGASLFDDGAVYHVCVKSADRLIDLQGSKYVRSDVGKTYMECATLLESGFEILYSGTPCQIAGLRRFLSKRVPAELYNKRLICVDLICHGTPNQKIFKAYLKWLAKTRKTDDGIHGYLFRSKVMGWGLYYYYYYYRKGKKYEKFGPARDDPYYLAFSKGLIYKDCCYKCPFARIERVGDITIGDYWGLEHVHPEFYDERGISAVLINTPKAKTFFEERCADKCVWIESSVDKIAEYNANLLEPAQRTSEGVKLAAEVNCAIASGDYEEVFGRLLAPKLSIVARIRGTLPWAIVHALYKFKKR